MTIILLKVYYSFSYLTSYTYKIIIGLLQKLINGKNVIVQKIILNFDVLNFLLKPLSKNTKLFKKIHS